MSLCSNFVTSGRSVGSSLLCAWPCLTFTIVVVELLARVPFAQFDLGQVSLPVVVTYYARLFGATYIAAARPKSWTAITNDQSERLRVNLRGRRL